MKHFRFACALVALGPVAAAAACPTAADLAKGIRFTLASGETDVYRASGDTRVTGTFTERPFAGSQYVLIQGIYIANVNSFENMLPVPDTSVETEYRSPDRDLPTPEAETIWTVASSSTAGQDKWSEEQTYSAGELSEVTLGDCTYEMIPITVTYSSNRGYLEQLHYLPELGVSYMVASESPDGRHQSTYVKIEALP